MVWGIPAMIEGMFVGISDPDAAAR